MEKVRITKVIRTGTSLCVVIPRDILQAFNLSRGDQVCFGFVNDTTLAIRKVTSEDLQKLKPSHEII